MRTKLYMKNKTWYSKKKVAILLTFKKQNVRSTCIVNPHLTSRTSTLATGDESQIHFLGTALFCILKSEMETIAHEIQATKTVSM